MRPPVDERLRSAMRQVESRVRRARWQLERRVRTAEAPLDVWERPGGLTGIRGQVLIVRDRRDRVEEIENAARGQGFQVDVAHSAREALMLLKIAKYQMVFLGMRDRRRGSFRVFHEIRRNFPGIRIVPIVRNADEGRQMMRQGAYSYLLPDFPQDQASTCVLSGLHLHNRVCQVLLRGDACDRSCVANFMREGELDDILAPTPEEPPSPDAMPVSTPGVDYYQEVE